MPRAPWRRGPGNRGRSPTRATAGVSGGEAHATNRASPLAQSDSAGLGSRERTYEKRPHHNEPYPCHGQRGSHAPRKCGAEARSPADEGRKAQSCAGDATMSARAQGGACKGATRAHAPWVCADQGRMGARRQAASVASGTRERSERDSLRVHDGRAPIGRPRARKNPFIYWPSRDN